MVRVGLTGGIACGKSQVLRRLAAKGIRTLDLDAVAHAAMAPGRPACDELLAAFGGEIHAPDGSIDRKALGAIVFADEAARERLNAIVHPHVMAEERAWAARQGGDEVLITDGALLVEAGLHAGFDRLVVVHCAPAEQLRRLMDRDGLSETAARTRIEAQMPLAEKRRFAHYHVDTSGTTDDTERTADRLAEELRALLPRPPTVSVPLERAAGGLIHGPETGPRQLTPQALLVEIAEAGGLEMERIARRLVPPPTGPWYRAGEPPGSGPRAEGLLVPLVLWALARGGPDAPFLAAAAASLARLFHSEDSAVSDACLFALTVQEVAASGRVPPDLEERARDRCALAQRFGGAPPTERLFALLRAASAHPDDPEAARTAAGAPDVGSSSAGALVGLGTGAPVARLPAAVRDSLLRLTGRP